MPAVSKAQARFMYAAAEGDVPGTSIDPKKAKEYIKDVRLKGLPERVKAAKPKG